MMAAETQTCPYCNALTTTTAVGRVICSRCGEAFVANPSTNITTTTAIPSNIQATALEENSSPKLLQATPPSWPLQLASLSVVVLVVSFLLKAVLTDYAPVQKALPFMVGLASLGLIAALWLWFFQRRRSNQAIVWFLFGNGLLMIAVALPFALLTRDFRRNNDPKALEVDEPSPPLPQFSRAVAPAQLPALGYLPRDTNLIAALHVRELLQEPDGRAFLEPDGWAPIELALRDVRAWTGLPPEALDHVVAGMRPGLATPLLQFPIPQPFIVVQTRQPYDVKQFSRKLTEGKKDEFRGRPLYRFQPKLGEGFLWCATERIFVLAVWVDGSRYEEVRGKLPERPQAGSAGLPESLRLCLEQRVGKNTLVWVAGNKAPAPLVARVLPFLKTSKQLLPDLSKINTFHLGLRFQKQVALIGEFQCADADAAQRLQRLLASQEQSGLVAPKVVGVMPSALLWATTYAAVPEPLATTTLLLAAQRQQKHRSQDVAEHWVSMQVRGSLAELRAALRR